MKTPHDAYKIDEHCANKYLEKHVIFLNLFISFFFIFLFSIVNSCSSMHTPRSRCITQPTQWVHLQRSSAFLPAYRRHVFHLTRRCHHCDSAFPCGKCLSNFLRLGPLNIRTMKVSLKIVIKIFCMHILKSNY